VKARSDWSFIPRVLYADPANRYVAGFGPPWRRAGAAVVDWGLIYVGFVFVSIPLGTLQAIGVVSLEDGDLGGIPGGILVVITQLLIAAPAVAYFAFLLPSSQTLGMRLTDVRIVLAKTGRGPSFAKALVRGVISTILAASVYAVIQYSTSFDKPSLDKASAYVLDAAYVLTGAALLSAATMIVTPTHRSLVDRLFGTAVLDDLEAVTPHMGPWGPVDAFDLSNRPPAEG
jgi:uncharacterized RDD family membrane protein YckC